MPSYKNIDYEVSEEGSGWKWIAICGDLTRSGTSSSKPLAIIKAMKAIDAITKLKRKAAAATEAVKWAASKGLQAPK